MSGALARRARYLKWRYRERFPRALADDDVPMSIDMSDPSSTLLIAFGGMRGRIGMPPFEFLKLTGEIPVKRVFVRDLRQAWYHAGLPPNGRGLLSVAEELRGVMAGENVTRLVVAGNSAGGYAALIFGRLLGADVVLSFAPQTILDLGELHAMDDHRWDERLGEVTAAGTLDPAWIDLRSALAEARRTRDDEQGLLRHDARSRPSARRAPRRESRVCACTASVAARITSCARCATAERWRGCCARR